MNPTADPTPPIIDPQDLTRMIAAATAIFAVAATIPIGVVWLYDGTLPHASLPRLAAGTVKVIHEGRWHDPAAAFPGPVRAHMPAATGWWLASAMIGLLVTAAAGAIWRLIDTKRARQHLGRRRYELRGAKPRDWARPRDLRKLIVRAPQPDRFTLGLLDRRLLATEPESHIAVIAPTRSGKTTRYVIPWLLEHDGPAVVTSTKTDILAATRNQRATLGEIFVWDPFGPGSCGWNPIHGCERWDRALQQARWLADAAQEGDSQIAAYWRGEAAKLLAPLLHAAAIGELTIDKVRSWVDMQDTEAPGELLEARDAIAAGEQLAAVAALDDRNRGTTYMSAGSLLAAYRHPQASKTSRDGVTPERLLEKPNTLYIVAAEHHQRVLAPLVVALISSILQTTTECANADRPLQPTLRLLMDEAANIAPLNQLPGHLSQAAGHGVRVATIWQSLGQMNHRYGQAADTILANSTTKLFMGPVGDQATWTYLQGLLGELPRDQRQQTLTPAGQPTSQSVSSEWRPRAAPDALQQLARGRALLISGALPSAVIQMRAH